jgi:hypothetical protein
MASGLPSGEGPAGRDVVFTLDRGYRTPLVRRGAVSLAAAGIAALLAGLGSLAVIFWPVAVVFGASALIQPCCTYGGGGS